MGWVVNATPRPLYHRQRGPMLRGSQGRFEWVNKISPPPGFDLQTVQSVASRYTDWAIAAQNKNIKNAKKHKNTQVNFQ